MLETLNGGGNPKPKVKYDPDQELRDSWNRKLAYDGNKSIKDVVLSAAQKAKIDPALLLSSSWQEGLNKAVLRPDEVSEAYSNYAKKDPSINQYPVDGFYNYGLDTFGNNLSNLQKYLPQGFDQRYKLYDAVNEKKEKIQTAAFKSNEDALIAKAAFMNYERDHVLDRAKQKGVDLTGNDNAINYFTLASYNGGRGNGNLMIDEYAKAKDKDAYINQGLTSRQGVQKNIAPRMKRMQLSNELLNMKHGGRMEYELGTEDPIDPIKGKPQLKAQPSVFDDNGQGFPSRNQAPGDLLQIFPLGEPVKEQGAIVPLSQFYDKATDKFGNTVLQGTGKYVDALGGVNLGADQQVQANQISSENLANATAWEQKRDNIEMPASAGIAAINAFFNKQNEGKTARKNMRKGLINEVSAANLNPYLEGTGSQAIMKDGGRVKYEDGGKTPNGVSLDILDGGKYKQISSSDHSNPMIEFQGKEHKDGGIGVQFGENVAEVENKEVGWVDSQGGLNVFGKLKFPGTNKTFRNVAKEMAKEEEKVDKTKSKYIQILNNANESDPYQNSATSTAKVMFKSLDKKSKEIAEKKEGLASYQHLILTMADKAKVQDIDKDNDSGADNDNDEMAYGGRLRSQFPKAAYGTRLNPDNEEQIQKIIDKYSKGKAPVSAKDFIEISKKYDVPVDLMLAQAIQESNIGTAGMAVRTKNIFNVGNNGNTGKTTDQGNFKAGLERYAKLIKDEYSTNGKVDVEGLLKSNFARPKKGGNYAEEKDYAYRVANIMNEINGDTKYSAPIQGGSNSVSSEDPKPDKFKNFKDKKTGGTYNSPEGLAPSVFYKDPEVVKALKDDQTWPKAAADGVWGQEHQKLWNSLPQAKKDEILKKSKESVRNVSNGTPPDAPSKEDLAALEQKPVDLTTITPIHNGVEGKVDNSKETPFGRAKKDPTQIANEINVSSGDVKRDYLSPLAMEQIAPELISLATNKREAVQGQSYNPQLKQTFDLSYQLGRNENQSTFNQLASVAEQTGNMDVLSQMAAQKYQADQQYNMQEVQGNAQNKLQTYNANIDILNDAQLKNLALVADQQVKQAQADYNTRKENMASIASISGKVLQNNLENKTYNAYANLFKHYGFDKKGNVTFNPDDVVQRFNEGEAKQFGMLSAQKGAAELMNATTKSSTKYDANGEVKQTTAVSDQLAEFNEIMQNRNLSDSQKQAVLRGNKYADKLFAQ